MRTLLGVLMMLSVSGGDETREGVLGDSVLLPCNCSEIDLEKDFIWQMEEPNPKAVFSRTPSNRSFPSIFHGGYNSRAEIFLPENSTNPPSNNCSLLLTNITAEDQGKYRCSFNHHGAYEKKFVYLNISARYNVCLTAHNLSKVFQCDVRGRHREASIQWDLDGQLLTNSTTTNITHTNNLDAPTGFYHFHSTLSTKLNWTSEPTCNVTAKDISPIISFACTGRTDPHRGDPDRDRYRCLIIIPIMVVIVLSLLLMYRWNLPQSLPRIREEETENFC